MGGRPDLARQGVDVAGKHRADRMNGLVTIQPFGHQSLCRASYGQPGIGDLVLDDDVNDSMQCLARGRPGPRTSMIVHDKINPFLLVQRKPVLRGRLCQWIVFPDRCFGLLKRGPGDVPRRPTRSVQSRCWLIQALGLETALFELPAAAARAGIVSSNSFVRRHHQRQNRVENFLSERRDNMDRLGSPVNPGSAQFAPRPDPRAALDSQIVQTAEPGARGVAVSPRICA